MAELSETRWAVASERGAEAADLTYAAARELVSKLAHEDVRGLCIVTNEAAQLLAKRSAQVEIRAAENAARGG